MHSMNRKGVMSSKRTRRNFSPEFKLESAQLVVDQGYTIKEAAKAVNVSESSIANWVSQLKKERRTGNPIGNGISPEQRRIKELEKKIKRVEMENDILKKATALLMSDQMNNLR